MPHSKPSSSNSNTETLKVKASSQKLKKHIANSSRNMISTLKPIS